MKGREVFHFESVAEMASTSTAVVHAEVVDVKPGRMVGDAESGGVDQAREVTLSVDTSFRRPFVSAPSTIVLEEWGVGWEREWLSGGKRHLERGGGQGVLLPGSDRR